MLCSMNYLGFLPKQAVTVPVSLSLFSFLFGKKHDEKFEY